MVYQDRKLVKYCSPDSQEWSDLYWGHIKYDPALVGSIEISTAPVSNEGMPSDEQFKLLELEQANKLLVFDFDFKSEQNPAPYCLVRKDKAFYKFNYRTDFEEKSYSLLHHAGQYWLPEEHDRVTTQDALPFKSIFNRHQRQFGTNPIDDEMVKKYKSHYHDWQKNENVTDDTVTTSYGLSEGSSDLAPPTDSKNKPLYHGIREPIPSSYDRLIPDGGGNDEDISLQKALWESCNTVPTSRGLSAGSSDPARTMDLADKSQDVGGESETEQLPLLNEDKALQQYPKLFVSGQYSMFSSPSPISSRLKRPWGIDLGLFLAAAAVCGFGVYLAPTYPIIGIALIGLGLLGICALVYDRFKPLYPAPEATNTGLGL